MWITNVRRSDELAPWVKKILKAHNPNHSLVRGGTLSTVSKHFPGQVDFSLTKAPRKRSGHPLSPTRAVDNVMQPPS